MLKPSFFVVSMSYRSAASVGAVLEPWMHDWRGAIDLRSCTVTSRTSEARAGATAGKTGIP